MLATGNFFALLKAQRDFEICAANFEVREGIVLQGFREFSREPFYVLEWRKTALSVPKRGGAVYERNIFTTKDSRFKSDSFLDELKRSYTDLINIYEKDGKS